MCVRSRRIAGHYKSISILNFMFLLLRPPAQVLGILSSGDPGPIFLKSSPYLTSTTSHFNAHIEGINVAPSGSIFAVQYGPNFNQVAQLYPKQILLYSDPDPNSYFNGMHFLNKTSGFLVDSSNNQRVVRLELDGLDRVIGSSEHCSHPSMLPLNDLAISLKSGLIFLSAMNWTNTSSNQDGQIWVCRPGGRATLLDVMGGVNGIALSWDERLLYATETFTINWIHVSSKIWKYDLNLESGELRNKRLFVDMGSVAGDSVGFAMDGIRSDAEGNLLAVRYGGSSVAVFSSRGKLVARIKLGFKNPSNLELVQIKGILYLFICGKCLEAEKGCVDVVRWPWNGSHSKTRLTEYNRKL